MYRCLKSAERQETTRSGRLVVANINNHLKAGDDPKKNFVVSVFNARLITEPFHSFDPYQLIHINVIYAALVYVYSELPAIRRKAVIN